VEVVCVFIRKQVPARLTWMSAIIFGFVRLVAPDSFCDSRAKRLFARRSQYPDNGIRQCYPGHSIGLIHETVQIIVGPIPITSQVT